jgi:hypothetical protein
MAVLTEAQIAQNRKCCAMFNHAVDVLGVASADILSLTTVKGTASTALEGMIRLKTPAEKDIPLQRQIADAMASAKDNSLLSDAGVAAADTLAGMRTLFTTNDANLTGLERSPYVLMP